MKRFPSKTARTRLAVEHLEDRTTPAGISGMPWLDGRHLTLSFAPDGTNAAGAPSSLNQIFSQVPEASWKTEILRAFQTWAVNTNINIGVVADNGQALGSTGLQQGDLRFGDIRIAGRSLDVGPHLAQTILPDYSGSTWTGDVMINGLYPFSIGNTSGQYDLQTSMLQEAGHAFGLANNIIDPTSVMWETYAYRTGLAASDVAAIQALYGIRQSDEYEGKGGNDSLSTASDMGKSKTPKAITADLTTLNDTDYYKFTTPSSKTGVDGLVVRLQTSGISPLMSRVTVYDGAGATIGSEVAPTPLDGDLAVNIPGVTANTTYYVKVEGVTGDVFAIGGYKLLLDYHYAGQATSTPTAAGTITFINNDYHSDDNVKRAQRLYSTGTNTYVTYRGSISDSTDNDFYRVDLPGQLGSANMMVTVSALDVNGLLPNVQIYDSASHLLPTQVVTNENGTFTVQLQNTNASANYYIRVNAFDAFGTRNVGNYALTADFTGMAPVQFTPLAGGTLSEAARQQVRSMSVTTPRLYVFSLSGDIAGSSTASAVRMTIFNAAGHSVFTQVGYAGRPLSTGTVYLGVGNYAISFNAATQTGATMPPLAFTVARRIMSDPIDAYPIEPDADCVTISADEPQQISTISLLDPISDPYAII